MKRTICIVSSCILLAVLMMVQTFAISRFDAYSYWATASNQFRFLGENFVDMFNYSKGSGMMPPASIQSDFYKNSYYSNNVALFTQYSTGTANESLLAYEPVFSWVFDPSNKSFPDDSTLSALQSYQWSDNGLILNQNSNIYATNTQLWSSDVGTPVLVYKQTVSFESIPIKGDHPTAHFGFVFYDESQNKKYCSASVFQDNGKYYFYPSGADPQFSENDNRIMTIYPDSYKSDRASSIKKVEIFLNTVYTLDTVIYNDSVSFYLNGNFVGNGGVFGYAGDNNANRNTCIFSTGSRMLVTEFSCKREVLPTATVIANLGRSITIPAGNDMEFYVNLKRGSVTNVTNSTTMDFDFSDISVVTLFLNNETVVNPAVHDDGWLYVSLPASDIERTFERCFFSFSTPYVTYSPGDQLQWNMEVAFSDLVFGDPDDIGYTPNIDPSTDKFRNEVIGGINDVKQEIHDGFDIINGTLEDVRQEIQDGFDMVEDALSRDDTFDDVTASPDVDIEHFVPESDALIQYEQIMVDAQQALSDAVLYGAQSFWQDVFSSILTIPIAGMMAVVSSSLLIIRALLGR